MRLASTFVRDRWSLNGTGPCKGCLFLPGAGEADSTRDQAHCRSDTVYGMLSVLHCTVKLCVECKG